MTVRNREPSGDDVAHASAAESAAPAADRQSAGADAPASRARLGTREHVAETLSRAREAIAQSSLRATRGRRLLERSGDLADTSLLAVQLSKSLRAQLRASITAYVVDLRQKGVPPERMIAGVKRTVRAAMPNELDVIAARELMEAAVQWSIDAYYDRP